MRDVRHGPNTRRTNVALSAGHVTHRNAALDATSPRHQKGVGAWVEVVGLSELGEVAAEGPTAVEGELGEGKWSRGGGVRRLSAGVRGSRGGRRAAPRGGGHTAVRPRALR
jgi:hypothetical protein